MPQFDTFSFFSQITWALFGFFGLFTLNTFVFLPATAITLKTRNLKTILGILPKICPKSFLKILKHKLLKKFIKA